MTFVDYLVGYAPFAPAVIMAAVLTSWLRSSRMAWVGAALIVASVPGFFLAMYLRGAGFEAFGGACTPDKARGFMEAMQWVFLAQVVAGIAGGGILSGLAIRKNMMIGVVSAVAMMLATLLSGFFIYFASGMTAVDGYRC
jgi:hypothetical protein